MIEMRWCGEQYPDWHADSEGRVYRCGVEVKPYSIDNVLANRYGVSQRLISGIVRRETWIYVADDELLAVWKRGVPDIVSAANF